MKKKFLVTITIVLCATFPACDDEIFSSATDKAETAAAEFCECMKKNSLSHCEDKLNTKYGYYSDNKDFINAFNKANTCGATISKK